MGELALPPDSASLARTEPKVAATREAAGGWRLAIVLLVLIIWLVPIKSYRLPVTLPFSLELYRLAIAVLVFAWVLSLLFGRGRVSAGSLGGAIVFLALAAVAAVLANHGAIAAVPGEQTQVIKSLSYFLSFLLLFVLVSSTARAFRDLHVITVAVVLGALIVAVAALVERRTQYNVFNHLQTWVPILRHDRSQTELIRFGRLRVRASSQHPIALGAALVMVTPLALYLAERSTSRLRSLPWLAAALVIAAGAAVTQSRTVVVMLLAMVVAGLCVRRRAVLSRWPLLVVAVVAVHFAAPKTLGTLYHSFRPKGGLVAQQQVRAGLGGSGRIADIRPGLRLWQAHPIFGRSLGTSPVRDVFGSPSAQGDEAIIFDDQWLGTLVQLGIVGLVGAVWLVWGAVLKTARAARRSTGQLGNFLVAASASCAGFAIGMFTFDSFAFVQVTMVFFLIAALGLRARALALDTSARDRDEDAVAAAS
jgi:hypothetical protein